MNLENIDFQIDSSRKTINFQELIPTSASHNQNQIKPKNNNKNSPSETFELPPNRYDINFPLLSPYAYTDIILNPTTPTEQLRMDIIKMMEKSHFYWNYNVPFQKNIENYYKFILPVSNFKEEGQINHINLPEYKFHSNRESLNSHQLKQIWENRTFTVSSVMENLPHLWSISPWLLHSSKERTRFFKKTLSVCLRLFYAIPNVINPCSERVIRVDICGSLLKPNIFNVFINFIGFFLNLFDFFFGFKFRTLNSDYAYRAEDNITVREFSNMCNKKDTIFKETYELCDLVLNKPKNPQNIDKIDAYHEELRKKISEISSKFNESFENDLKKELNKEDFEDDEIEAIRSSISETKQDKLNEFIENRIKDEKDSSILTILSILLKKIKAINIFKTLSFEKQEKILKERKRFSDQIEKNRPIYHLIGYKRERLIDKLMKPIEELYKKEFLTSLENELKANNLLEELELFKNYENFALNHSNLYKTEVREMRKYCLKPVNKFTIKYPLFASQYKRERINNFWYLVKEESVVIYSNFMFYKVVKALASYFIKLYSLMFKIIKWIWEGSFGIKSFFLCSDFYTDYSINVNTAEIKKNQKVVRPILRLFLGVIHGIQKSRRYFEEAPDDGFFGKNFGRVINILNCILIRFLFVGVLMVLIIHPIVNIICIFGGFLACITTLIWLVIVEVFLLTWKLLINDYKSTLRHHASNYYDQTVDFYEHSYLKLLRSYKWFTLLHLSIDFLFNVIIQLMMVIIMMIFSPLISAFVFAFGISLYILKSIWDFFILNVIVRCFARVPSRNSTFAYRISGPGISRDFYNTLETKDLILLIIAHMERLEMDQLLKEGNLILEYPKNYIDQHYKTLFHKFMNDNSNNEYMKDSFKNIQFLKDSLNYYINERKKHLPKINVGGHTIRFTKEELEKNEHLVEELLKEFIKEKDMERYIWDLYHLRPGLYKRLTRKILEQVLCAEATKPVEFIDHVEKVKFQQNTTHFSNFISSYMNEDNEIHKKTKAYLQKLKDNNKKPGWKPRVFVSIEEVMAYYSNTSSYYNEHFQFRICDDKAVKNWSQGKDIELTQIKIQY